EADVADARLARHTREDVLRVRHLRHAFRVHEARRFDAADAAREHAPDELELDGGRNGLGLALQPVARRHLDDFDLLTRHCLHTYPRIVYKSMAICVILILPPT